MPNQNQTADPYSAYGGSVAPAASAESPSNSGSDPYAAYGGSIDKTPASQPQTAPAASDPYSAYGGAVEGSASGSPTSDPYAAYGGAAASSPASQGGFLHDIWNDIKDAPQDAWNGLKDTNYGMHLQFDPAPLNYLVHGEFKKYWNAANDDARANILGVPKSQVVVDAELPQAQPTTIGGKIWQGATTPMLGTFHTANAGPVDLAAQKFITGQITPLNIGLGVAGLGESAATDLLTKAGIRSGLTVAKAATMAAKTAKVAKIATNLYFLTKMGYGLHGNFEQISNDMNDVENLQGTPNEARAYDKLKEDSTTAILNGLTIAAAGHGLAGEVAGGWPNSATSTALRNEDYAEGFHENQKANQIAAAQQEQIVNEFKKTMPDPIRRQAAVDYREAGGDTDLLKQREADANARVAAATTPMAKAQAEALAEGYKTAQSLTPDEKALIGKVGGIYEDWENRLQALGKIKEEGGRPNYVPHEYQFEEQNPETGERTPTASGADAGFLKVRKYPTYAEAEAQGFVPQRKDLGALTADYIDRASRLANTLELTNSLHEGYTSEGVPLTAPGGYIEGQRVSSEYPQNRPLTEDELENLTPEQIEGLKRSGRIVDQNERTENRLYTPAQRAALAANPQPLPQVRLGPDGFDIDGKPVENTTVYRSRDVGEKGVPSQSNSQATASLQEAKSYLDSRARTTGKPQQLIAIDLSKLKSEDYTVMPGPNGSDWVKFNKDLPESAVEKAPSGPRLYWNFSDYKPSGLVENRALGSTPIPAAVVADLKARGVFDDLLKKGTLYQGKNGDVFASQSIQGLNTPVYVHPDIAEHLRNHFAIDEPGKIGRLVDQWIIKPSAAIKSVLLSWSPFHRMTEAFRLMQSMGVTKGLHVIANPEPIDYFNLRPDQEAAMRNGLVVAGTRTFSKDYMEEGLAAGENTLGAKTYRWFRNGLTKLGVPDHIVAKFDPEQIFTTGVFGPDGQIARYKFAMYNDLTPKLAEAILKDHPEMSADEVNAAAGKLAAYQVNNIFGGINYSLLGRSLQTQKALRALLLAPDFLESTGRNLLDVVEGGPLLRKFIEFNLVHLATARVLNYALHHKEEPNTAEGILKAMHPESGFAVLGTDGKTYDVRSTLGDFLHMIQGPRDFLANRINPLLKGGKEYLEGRDQWGRKETPDLIRQTLRGITPLPLQAAGARIFPGIYGNGLTEPNWVDIGAKAVGVNPVSVVSPATELALQKNGEQRADRSPLQGQDLLRMQLRIRVEDKLRQAYQEQDPEKRKQDVANATAQINSLAQRKMIDPRQRTAILNNAKLSRLQSLFKGLSYESSLEVWNDASIQEKVSLGTEMTAKYIQWRESIIKEGHNLNNLPPDEQMILNGFRAASTDLAGLQGKQ